MCLGVAQLQHPTRRLRRQLRPRTLRSRLQEQLIVQYDLIGIDCRPLCYYVIFDSGRTKYTFIQ